MLRTSFSSLTEQLQVYCNTINSECTVLKSTLQNQPKSGKTVKVNTVNILITLLNLVGKAELSSLKNITMGLGDLESRTDVLANAVMGPIQTRLNEITVEEVIDRYE